MPAQETENRNNKKASRVPVSSHSTESKKYGSTDHSYGALLSKYKNEKKAGKPPTMISVQYYGSFVCTVV